jgi:ribonuclease G
MQSAFVDIGLDRDAFLYVSDFFFEDQEDFDKIVEEAETRAVHFTAEPAPALPPAEAANKEATAPTAAAVPAPSPITAPSPTLPEGPPVVLPTPERVATPAPETTPPASSSPAPGGEGHERKPLEPRGRRWRRRGRKFGEHRHGDHKFAPRQEDSPPSSFEILPGESLAKYSHGVTEAQGVESAEDFPAEQEPLESLEPDYGDAEVDLDAEGEISEETLAEASSMTDHLDAESELETAESPVVEAEAPAPETPTAEPVIESMTAESFLEASDDLEVSDVFRPEEEQSAEETEEPESLVEEDGGAPLSEETETEPVPETVQPEPIPESTRPAADQELPVQQEPAPVVEGSSETPTAPSEGTYTLREPHQRPRFAPRRGRRGRRGGGGYQGRGDVKRESRPGNNQPVQISKLLKEGQEILVQISKEPLGTKGARITSHVALPGRYLVYMPTVDHIGVSRKIVSEEERLRLRNIILEHKGPLTGGFIVRTAAQDRSEEELKADLKSLSTLWNEIRSKAERAKAPALIHRDLDLVQRVLRDTLTPDFKCVRVDNEIEYERVLDFVNRSQPSLVGKVRLYTREIPLFEEFGIHAEIEKALKPKVWLKSGGYIVINQTEALVAIDVNTGKYVGKTNRLEDTILKTNVDAVNEIVRQVRLRDLGGIIVIDFIDMDERKNRAKVTQALEEALRKDRAPTKVIAFHDFGLVAITRKRVKQSLERTLCERCSYCSGSGWVKSPTTVCYEILAEARKMASQIDGKVMTVRVNPEVAKALKSREGVLVSELESLTHKDIIVRSDSSVHQERFEIF